MHLSQFRRRGRLPAERALPDRGAGVRAERHGRAAQIPPARRSRAPWTTVAGQDISLTRTPLAGELMPPGLLARMVELANPTLRTVSSPASLMIGSRPAALASSMV